MKALILVRHGETEWNDTGRWQGSSDVALNDAGLAQARALAERARSWRIDAVYASDLQRAFRTAEIVAEPHGLRPEPNPAWRERGVGVFEGLTMPEAIERYPDIYGDVRSGDVAPPEGESTEMLFDRIVPAYRELLEAHPGDEDIVAIFSHGGTIANLIAHIIGLPPEGRGHIRIGGNTAVSRIIYSPSIARLALLNDTAHLEDWA